jgi:hypothetical protein
MASALRRRSQRGASVLIVLLVIVMLTGIGMFAARSSTLATAVAGSSKQLTTTQYVSEYAIMSATAALARDPQRYVNQMPRYVPAAGDPKCFGYGVIPNATCFPLSFSQLQTEAGVPLILPTDAQNKLPGGLGRAALEPDFNIDITDLSPASPPVPGEALNADSPVKVGYLSLTLTSTAQLRPPTNAQNFGQTIATSASVQTWRAHIVVGPMTNPAARSPLP